jgi:uncharacterized membrane protein YphA (DoxX/SURF4 family)
MSASLSLVYSVAIPLLATAEIGGGSVDLLVTGLQVVLGLLFLLTGGLKIVGVDQMVQYFESWRYPQWFRVVTGLVEATGGLVFIGGVAVPILTLVGGVFLVGTMFGAIYTHVLRVGDPHSETAKPTVLLFLVGIVIVFA